MEQAIRLEEFYCSNCMKVSGRKSEKLVAGCSFSTPLKHSLHDSARNAKGLRPRCESQNIDLDASSVPQKLAIKDSSDRVAIAANSLIFELPESNVKTETNFKYCTHEYLSEDRPSLDSANSGLETAESTGTSSDRHSVEFFSEAQEQDRLLLKEQFSASLSPSPFLYQDDSEMELSLKHFDLLPYGANGEIETHSALFPSIYGSEMGSMKLKKKALRQYIMSTLDSLCIIKKLKPIPSRIVEKRRLPEGTLDPSRRTLVFDLDETLLHCVTNDIDKAEKIIEVTLNTCETIQAGVNIRPGVVDCLHQLAAHYNLVLFTASRSDYAEVAADLLDPDHTLFKLRLYRNSCIETEAGFFIKDLRILNCDLSTTLIVDNAIYSFAFQIDNGIPIIPFYDDKEDKIFPKITNYLLSLKEVEDVREINRLTFSLSELRDLNLPSFVKYYHEEDNEISVDNPVSDDDELWDGAEFSRHPEKIKIGRRAQQEVDSQLLQIRQCLPKFLANNK